LAAFEELNLKMSIKELLKDDNETMNIDGISSKNGFINIIFNKPRSVHTKYRYIRIA
jgi:hypothetical protein